MRTAAALALGVQNGDKRRIGNGAGFWSLYTVLRYLLWVETKKMLRGGRSVKPAVVLASARARGAAPKKEKKRIPDKMY